jgi:hypothetical protein
MLNVTLPLLTLDFVASLLATLYQRIPAESEYFYFFLHLSGLLMFSYIIWDKKKFHMKHQISVFLEMLIILVLFVI